MAEGYVYILINPSFRLNRYKIGMTTRTPAERAAELSRATGVPEPFEVVYARMVSDCVTAERRIKTKLEVQRIAANREFYDIPLQDAVTIVNYVADQMATTLELMSNGNLPNESENIEPVHTSVEGEIDADYDIHIPPTKLEPTRNGKNKGRKSIEEHLNNCHPTVREIFQKFRAVIKAIDPEIQENSWSYGVAYRAKQNFIEMYFRSNRLEVCLRPKNYDDPMGLLGEVPPNYKWTLNRRFLLEDDHQIAYLASLAKQSWEDVTQPK